MAVERIVLRSQRISIEEETTEGTPVAETANGALLVSEEGAEFNLSRDNITGAMMSGSFTLDAPEPGMWSDDLGVTIPTKMRGIGTLSSNGPDWHMLAKSIFGVETRATNGTVDTGATAITIPVKTGGVTIIPGMLLYFPTQGEVRRVSAFSSPNVTLDVPLSSIPSEDDVFKCGVNWTLSSSPSHPIFTVYGYFGASQGRRVRLTSCKCMEMTLELEVGGHCDMSFTSVALSPTYDTTAQAVTPNYDDVTQELVCLDMSGWLRVAGVITGSPTTTETVLLTPNFDVRVGDSIQVDTGSGVWETKTITAVSGSAPANLTLTHGTLSGAGTATETCYILRSACADTGETLSITMSCPVESEKCMFTTYGKNGLANVSREITIESEPYFQSWEQFLMRDNSVGGSLMAILGDVTANTDNNLVAIYISKKVNTEVSLTNDTIMKQSVTSQASKDATLGNDYEMVMAAF